jgi:hypothetical protein
MTVARLDMTVPVSPLLLVEAPAGVKPGELRCEICAVARKVEAAQSVGGIGGVRLSAVTQVQAAKFS